MTFITNDCLAYFMYQKAGMSYASPFIGSLFESDEQYVKFCQNFNEYIKMEPVFGEPKMPVTIATYKDAPVMFLGDIEIHWPHEKKGKDYLLSKYKLRLERIEKPVFIWSDMQRYNVGNDHLKENFKKINSSLFVEKNDIEIHQDKSMDDRNDPEVYVGVPGTFRVLRWLDYNVMAAHVLKRLDMASAKMEISFNEEGI